MNREALRQQMLVRALWRDDAALQAGWLRPTARASAADGLGAYRGNASALAERALAAAYPTVAALVGAESFAALARHFWRHHPPTQGDLGAWGEALPAFVADREQFADEPYLADSAHLDWAVHRAARAADVAAQVQPLLAALAQGDPARLRLQLAPGAALRRSPYPIVTVWRAHHGGASFDDARAAFAAGRAECAFVWRDEALRVRVEALADADAAFTAALLAGAPLAAALDGAGGAFAFDRWLARALAAHWLAAAHPTP